MKKLIALTVIGLCCRPVRAAVPVSVGAEQLIVENFSKWTAQEGGCENITNFASPYANRGTVEAVLACKALKLGGYDGKFELVAMPNYERALVNARAGELDLPAETIWEIDLDANYFYATEPLIAKGEFEKGVYVTAENQNRLAVNSLSDLQKLSAVMPKRWRVDWTTLEGMKIKAIDVATKEDIFRALSEKRGNFTLLEFSANPGLANEFVGIKLLPVRGVKVALDGQRRLAVAKKSANGAAIFAALNKGIIKLRKDGSIERAWRESGFISAKTKDWKLLN